MIRIDLYLQVVLCQINPGDKEDLVIMDPSDISTGWIDRAYTDRKVDDDGITPVGDTLSTAISKTL